MKKTNIIYGAIITFFISQATVLAEGPPWSDHQKPYSFTFGINVLQDIDDHQQIMVLPDGTLKGFFYIEFTGDYTFEGYPIAKHTDCSAPNAECTVGWQWEGVSVPEDTRPTFAYRESGDHPTWLVGSRNDIPQPGGYSHFHWYGAPENATGLVEGVQYDGYFLKLTAKDTFVFQHGGDEILITPGLDLSSHLNIISSLPEE